MCIYLYYPESLQFFIAFVRNYETILCLKNGKLEKLSASMCDLENKGNELVDIIPILSFL